MADHSGARLDLSDMDWTGQSRSRKRLRRHARLVRTLLSRLQGRLSEVELELATADAMLATEQDLKAWAYRALFHRCWSSIVTRGPVTGVDLVGFDALVANAIACPLEMWCVRAFYYRPRFDDEFDTNILTQRSPLASRLLRHRRRISQGATDTQECASELRFGGSRERTLSSLAS